MRHLGLALGAMITLSASNSAFAAEAMLMTSDSVQNQDGGASSAGPLQSGAGAVDGPAPIGQVISKPQEASSVMAGGATEAKDAAATPPTEQAQKQERYRKAIALRKAREPRFPAPSNKLWERALFTQSQVLPPRKPVAPANEDARYPFHASGRCVSLACPSYVLLGVGF
jgi:hypothetical protein